MSVVLLSSSGPMCMTSGTPTSPSSLTVMAERSWRELEIYLNKPWMAALPSLPKVCTFVLIMQRTVLQYPYTLCLFFDYTMYLMYQCVLYSSHLPAVRQIGGGIWFGSTCHGCLWKSNWSSGNWGETPHVQHLHQESSWNIWSHIYQSNLPESNWGK